MAIDTAEKRRMALDFGKIRGTGMPVPSGMTSISERAHILNLYFETSVTPPFFFWRNKNIIGGIWSSKTTPSSSWSSKKSPSSSWSEKVTPQDGSTQVI